MCASAQTNTRRFHNIHLPAMHRAADVVLLYWLAQLFPRKFIMNKNQTHGAVKDVAGKVQAETGKLMDNKEQQAKGLQKQGQGKAEKKVGDAKEILKDASGKR